MEALLGRDLKCSFYHSNTSYPRFGSQNIHNMSLCDFVGQKTPARWTPQVSERRSLRLTLGQTNGTEEDGYGQVKKQSLTDGTILLPVGCLPIYLRGIVKPDLVD